MIAQIVPVKRGAKTLPFFDYTIPDSLSGKLKIGQLVYIPLRKSLEFGVVVGITDKPTRFLKNLRPIDSIVFTKPFISKKMLEFLIETSEFYSSSLGSLIKSTLPPLKIRKLKKIETNFDSQPEDVDSFTKPNLLFYDNLEGKKKVLLENISNYGQTLILLPEVNDSENIYKFLEDKNPNISSLINNNTSEKKFFDEWFDIWKGTKKIIVTTRLGIFLSFHNLKRIIVVDDFHFGHKSWDSAPRYSSRDAALSLGKHLGASVTLITHTPSVEDYYFSQKQIFSAKGSVPVLSKAQIVNMQSEKRSGNKSSISLPLEEAIENSSQGNTFVYCNRKGSASYISCKDCSKVKRCSNCGVTMTWHEKEKMLFCHHCNIKNSLDQVCDSCGGVNLLFIGSGIDGIAKELKKMFPKKEIITVEKNNNELDKIRDLKGSIIVGTQAAWQHLDWSNIETIAFADADTPLFTPEYLATENLWFMIRDATARTKPEAALILQTSNPEHPIYTNLATPEKFYQSELESRKIFDYPPFRYILKLFISARSEQEITASAANFHNKLLQLTKSYPNIKITQPLNIFPYYLKGNYRKTIILKLPYSNYKQLTKLITKILPEGWKTDPNPITLLSI